MTAFDVGSLLALCAALLMAVGIPADDSQSPMGLTTDQSARAVPMQFAVECALLLSALLASTALFFGRLATPLMMRALSFDPQAIAAAVAIGGFVGTISLATPAKPPSPPHRAGRPK